MPKERQRSILGGFWGPFETPLGVLLSMLEELWSFLGIFWVQHAARNVKMRASREILAQAEVGRGSQKLSMGRFWEDFHDFLCASWYFGVFFVLKRFCACSFVP